jgi:putative hydrolase of the HAD superfamily
VPSGLPRRPERVWLFDLDNTLHDASHAVFHRLDDTMTGYIAEHLGVEADHADWLRREYWRRYGATLLGLERHHGVRAAHFLDHTHRLPGLESALRMAAHDRVALERLPGRKLVLTNAPAAYAKRVLTELGLAGCFEAVVSIEGMRVFGQLRPKPDARMLRVVLARLKLTPARTVLVEDTVGHLRAARRVGMGTVWMQRYLRGDWRFDLRDKSRAMGSGPEVGIYLRRKPRFVCARIKSLQELRRWNPSTRRN